MSGVKMSTLGSEQLAWRAQIPSLSGSSERCTRELLAAWPHAWHPIAGYDSHGWAGLGKAAVTAGRRETAGHPVMSDPQALSTCPDRTYASPFFPQRCGRASRLLEPAVAGPAPIGPDSGCFWASTWRASAHLIGALLLGLADPTAMCSTGCSSWHSTTPPLSFSCLLSSLLCPDGQASTRGATPSE